MFTKNWYRALALFLGSNNGEFGAKTTYKMASGNSTEYTSRVFGVGFGATGQTSSYTDGFGPSMKFVTTSGNGVHFGTGTTEPIFDDYKLSGDVISASKFSYSAVLSSESDDEGISYTAEYTISNTDSDSFTIGEIGLFTYATNNIGLFMVERTVLDEPVTIPAGGVGRVTYTIRMEYPTA